MIVLSLAQLEASPQNRSELVAALTSGGLLCLPVGGTYRLLADVRSEAAVNLLIQSKRRAKSHPALIFVPDLVSASAVVDGTDWSTTKQLATFWPRALTLVLPPNDGLPRKIVKTLTRATGKLGVRVPADPLALSVLREFGAPVLVSSANIEKKAGATSAVAVRQRFGNALAVWLDVGDPRPAPPSTVVEVSPTTWKVIREGDVTTAELGDPPAG